MSNTTALDSSYWNSEPAWKLPGWCEPLMVTSILFFAMYMTRKRDYRVFDRPSWHAGYLDGTADESNGYHLLSRIDVDSDDDEVTTAKTPIKTRRTRIWSLDTTQTGRFRNNIHSRILQKLPFLIEMFYWILNYAFYRMTSVLSSTLFAGQGIWDVAQENGISILEAEQYSCLRFLFPFSEQTVQQWFIQHHPTALTILNKSYALIHIPATVGFICWYYHAAPSFPTFATARRTLTLTNFCAFLTFILYPCMPPRLLPASYGFLDTVRHDDAQSVWMSGKFVNQLAAMPSMHFGYAFCIGMTLVYHSGLFRRTLEKGEMRKSLAEKGFWLLLGVGYPAFILVTIVATANHYFADAVVAAVFVAVSWACNRVFCVFVPLENVLLWVLRVEKPVPTTGRRGH